MRLRLSKVGSPDLVWITNGYSRQDTSRMVPYCGTNALTIWSFWYAILPLVRFTRYVNTLEVLPWKSEKKVLLSRFAWQEELTFPQLGTPTLYLWPCSFSNAYESFQVSIANWPEFEPMFQLTWTCNCMCTFASCQRGYELFQIYWKFRTSRDLNSSAADSAPRIRIPTSDLCFRQLDHRFGGFAFRQWFLILWTTCPTYTCSPLRLTVGFR